MAHALPEAFRSELVEVRRVLSEHAELLPHHGRGCRAGRKATRFTVAIVASVGLGKTRTACAVVRALRDNGGITQAAVIFPRKLERNWRNEFIVVGRREVAKLN